MNDFGEILLEGTLFKMKKTLTGFKWKKKWVRSDGVKLLQWATDAKPTGNTKPKHAYILVNCSVREITAQKPHAFCVHENSKNDMMVFAAKNAQQATQWIKVLSGEIKPKSSTFASASVSPATTHQGTTSSNTAATMSDRRHQDEDGGDTEEPDEPLPDDLAASKEDLAVEYFEEYNISSQHMTNKRKIAIDGKLFPDLLAYIGVQLSNSDLFFALQSLKNENGTISLKDFLLWLEQHPELNASDDEGGLGDEFDLLASRHHKQHPRQELSLECDELLRVNHSGSTWLNIAEPVHLAGTLDCALVDLVKSATTVMAVQNNMPSISDVIKSWPLKESVKDWNGSYQKYLEKVTDSDVDASKLNSSDYEQLYDLCALQGHFVQAAVAGSMTIVDEYSLPTKLKTATLINVRADVEGEDVSAETEEEVYFLNNLVFRLIGYSSTDKDRKPSEARLQFVILSDEIVHKMAGNSFRGHEAVKKALNMISSDACFAGERPFNASVLLTTIVDYCGFRLQVFSPINDLDEASTLVYGYATAENVFINALSIQDYLAIPALAKHMNLSFSYSESLTATEILNKRNPAAAKKVTCEILSKELQLHLCLDDRIYLFNFNNFLPPDFPRPDSNDVNTRHLRPEFIEHCAVGSVDSQAVRSTEHADIPRQSQERNRTMSGGIASEFSKLNLTVVPDSSLQSWIKAATHLHVKVIPEVTHQLDTMSVLPMDSCGLTEFLHSRGVNMRYLGKIYKLSRAPHVRDLILSEAIGRAVKSILNQTLKNISRKGRSETIIAEERKRSKKEDFLNHQVRILTSKTAAVVYLFNVVLGFGEETDKFWTGMLPKVLLSKFGLEMPSSRDKTTLVFFPQLVHALEYHTNVYFSTEKKFHFASPSYPEPFGEDDLVHYDCNIKFDLNYSGIFHRYNCMAEAFLASNMLPQAIVAFKIRLSTQNIFLRGIAKDIKKLKHQIVLTTYKLALCYYLDKKYDLTCALLRSLWENVERKQNPMRGRILTLLMCADFKSDRINDAMQHYERARLEYIYSLGLRHPAIALLYTALADLYFSSNAFSHAKLLVYKALDFIQRTQGVAHIMNACYYYKLGAIMLADQAYCDAIDMFKQALERYTLYSANGAEFGHEISVCYHGLAIANAHLANTDQAISFCKSSLALSTAGDKYITPHAVSCIILLAEESEKKQDLKETINLYTDAWTIVQAYSKDYDLPKILTIIAARLFSTFINSQPMHFRMLFHTVGAECESKNIPLQTVEMASAYIVQEITASNPVSYISSLFQLITKSAENVLSTKSKYMIGTQKSVFGVPCPRMHQSEDTNDHKTLAENFVELCEDEYMDNNDQGIMKESVEQNTSKDPSPPPDLQAMLIVRMIQNLCV